MAAHSFQWRYTTKKFSFPILPLYLTWCTSYPWGLFFVWEKNFFGQMWFWSAVPWKATGKKWLCRHIAVRYAALERDSVCGTELCHWLCLSRQKMIQSLVQNLELEYRLSSHCDDRQHDDTASRTTLADCRTLDSSLGGLTCPSL